MSSETYRIKPLEWEWDEDHRAAVARVGRLVYAEVWKGQHGWCWIVEIGSRQIGSRRVAEGRGNAPSAAKAMAYAETSYRVALMEMLEAVDV